jgi:glucose/arabinose dehydrogenase
MGKTSYGQRLAPLAIAVIVTAGCGGQPGAAQQVPIASEQATFELVTVVRGLEHPWGMAFLPDGDVLVTERPGRLRLVQDGVLHPEPVAGVPPVYASGQGGLLDVALDPGFASNQVIYLSYAAEGDGGNSTRVARATLGAGRLEGLERSSSPCRWCARASISARVWRSTQKAICS